MGSPFHRGEQEVQTRVGVRQDSEGLGQRLIRDFMPEQHRAFFARLPFIVIGAADERGALWASLLAGPPGFISSPDPHTLDVDAPPLPADPLGGALVQGRDLGLLGIEPETRRRNRLNGPIVRADASGLAVKVVQSFGNCPKYITRRRCAYAPRAGGPARLATRLDLATTRAIEQADTFFIATDSGATPPGRASGADVSHRGGPPGFVRADGPTRLTWPDYAGNDLYNTLGNLVVNPRAGLLFPDFDAGDLLHLSGRTELVWDGPELALFPGARRLIHFQVEQVLHRPGALPLRCEEPA
jgi:predicted pyridoxine 5'-phosphate oxidase superfamily flavin-nucleotide-binding protein